MRSLIERKASNVVASVVVCGNEAAMVFGIRAGSGDSGIMLDAVDIFEVDDDGKIASMRAYWDMNRATPAADPR